MIWYGLILLTLLYGGFVLVVEFSIDDECLDEPCNSEGLDNTILGWTTDFFIATGMIFLGLHLWIYHGKDVHSSAIVALIFMALSYVLGGLGHSIWSNSGYDDNIAQQEYFIAWAVAFTLMTVSVHQTFRFVHQILEQYCVVDLPNQTLWTRFLMMGLNLVIIAWGVTVAGYSWCASQTDLHVDDVIDEFPDLDRARDLDECYGLAAWGEFSWYVAFSLFWIPSGALLRKAILLNDSLQERVYGLPNALAALLCPVIAWTFGIMLIVWTGVVAIILNEDAINLYATIYAAVIYHFGMLAQYFLFHNLALSLSKDKVAGNLEIPYGKTASDGSNGAGHAAVF